MSIDFSLLLSELETLRDCTLCPRHCHADRFSQNLGYCQAGTGFSISSICIHRGEEPVISGSRGICNIFFTNCNLQCTYCQNYQISDNRRNHASEEITLREVIRQITEILDIGINIVGFVTPSHFIPQMKIIIRAIEEAGYHPSWVYNTNGYDNVDTLRSLEGIIDVYLPDFKYFNTYVAKELSDASDYPEVASAALKEMYRQKGSTLLINEQGYAESGILIRHLVLPGQVENSQHVLKFIAEEISPHLHIGLMSQYSPTRRVMRDPVLGRALTKEEYNRVIATMERLGMSKGFIQEMESFAHYRPDFNKNHPFESD